MENMDNVNWEDFSPVPADPGELKKIRKSIRKNRWLTVLTSVVLVAALIFGAVQYGIPALERRYWDPTECTYLENVPDMELTMVTYNQLFGQGQHIMEINIEKTGFAAYSLNTSFLDWKTIGNLTEVSNRHASLNKGELNCSEVFWFNHKYSDFSAPESKNLSVNKRDLLRHLAKMPECVELLVSISFPDYITLDQLISLSDQYANDKMHVIWAVLQTNAENPGWPLCGTILDPYNEESYVSAQWDNTDYPNLFMSYNHFQRGENLEDHVKSMLRYSADQLEKGTGILPPNNDPDFYTNTLAYMEENGVNVYGCNVLITPATLLEMIDDGIVRDAYIQDAWIGF